MLSACVSSTNIGLFAFVQLDHLRVHARSSHPRVVHRALTLLPMRRSTRLLLHYFPFWGRRRAPTTARSGRSRSGGRRGIGALHRDFTRRRPLSHVVARGLRGAAAQRKMAAEEDAPARSTFQPSDEDSHDIAASIDALVLESALEPADGATSVPGHTAPAANATSDATDAAGRGGGGGRIQTEAWFHVSDSVKLALHLGDITRWYVDGENDAIVNAANSKMLGGGGVDGAIHRQAGRQLLEACRRVPEVSRGVRCPVGEARITPGFNLPVAKVIHAVGPVYFRHAIPAVLLGNAYRNSLSLAIRDGIKFIAFPAISCGIYSYPADEAANVSLSVIKEASTGLSEVHVVLFEPETYSAWLKEASKQFERVLFQLVEESP